MSRVALLAALVYAAAIGPPVLAAVLRRCRRRPPRPRREYPPLNPHVPMPADLAVPHGQCGCELVWRPCQVHDPAWPAAMAERMAEQ